MRATFARQRDARRRRRQDEASILVAGIVQRIEPARNERVIKRADRQQTLAIDAVGKAEGRQQDEQIHLRNAQFDVLAFGREFPVECRGDALAFERVSHRLTRKQPAAVNPGPQIRGYGNVRRCGDDMAREVVVVSSDLVEDRAKSRLGGHHRLNGDGKLIRHVDCRCAEASRSTRGERHTIQK